MAASFSPENPWYLQNRLVTELLLSRIRLGLFPLFPGMMTLKSLWMKPLIIPRRPPPCEPSAERPRKCTGLAMTGEQWPRQKNGSTHPSLRAGTPAPLAQPWESVGSRVSSPCTSTSWEASCPLVLPLAVKGSGQKHSGFLNDGQFNLVMQGDLDHTV